MPACAVVGCTNKADKKLPGITFHGFPADPVRRAEWVKAVRRKNWEPSSCSKLCSEHFSEDQMDRTSLSCVRLRANAIPNIFKAFPSYLQVKKQGKPSCERNAQIIIMPPSPAQDATVLTTETVVLQQSPKQALKRKLHEAQECVTRYKKKIRILQQSKRRQQQKIESLQGLLDNIKKQKLMDDDLLEVLNKASGVNKELLIRQLAAVQNEKQPKCYSPELRAFALTLNFYSPRAYKYVRKTFSSCLPHSKTICKWYQHVPKLLEKEEKKMES